MCNTCATLVVVQESCQRLRNGLGVFEMCFACCFCNMLSKVCTWDVARRKVSCGVFWGNPTAIEGKRGQKGEKVRKRVKSDPSCQILGSWPQILKKRAFLGPFWRALEGFEAQAALFWEVLPKKGSESGRKWVRGVPKEGQPPWGVQKCQKWPKKG